MPKKKFCCEGMMQLHNIKNTLIRVNTASSMEELHVLNELLSNCPFCKREAKRILTDGGYFDLEECARIFVIDNEQIKKYKKWRNDKKVFPKLKHNEAPREERFVFTPTGIGLGVHIECDGKEIDLSDYDNW